MKSNILIVIQGPSSNVNEQKQAWKGYDVIFSTWKGSEQNYVDTDNVIYNDIPADRGPSNFWMQQHTTIVGLKKAQELGYTYCLKLRSDLVPTHTENFVNCLDKEKLNFLCWHNHEVYPNCPGYLVDYLMSGPTEQLIKLWETDEVFCTVPEVVMTWNYITKCNNYPKKYFLNDLNENNDLNWIKKGIRLLSYKNEPSYDVYKKFYFSNENAYLTENYVSFLKLHKTDKLLKYKG